MASSFHGFARLPLELRILIWRHACPEDGPAIFFFRKGLWVPRWLPETDPAYLDDSHIEFEFRDELLEMVRVPMPIAPVNREACDVVIETAVERGCMVRVDPQGPVCKRPFENAFDTLYVSEDQLNDFIMEPHDRSFEADMLGQGFSVGPRLKRIAVPAQACSMSTIAELRSWFLHLTEIAVVVAPTTLDAERRWELRPESGNRFVWAAERGRVEAEGKAGDSSLRRWIDDFNNELTDGSAELPTGPFEVYVATALSVET